MRGYKFEGSYYCPDCVAREMDPDTRLELRAEADRIDEDAPGGRCGYCDRMVGIDPEPDPSTCAWLTAVARAPYNLDSIEAALGFGGVIVASQVVKGHTLALVRCPKQHAVWNQHRLASCLYGGHRSETREEADANIRDLAEIYSR